MLGPNFRLLYTVMMSARSVTRILVSIDIILANSLLRSFLMTSAFFRMLSTLTMDSRVLSFDELSLGSNTPGIIGRSGIIGRTGSGCLGNMGIGSIGNSGCMGSVGNTGGMGSVGNSGTMGSVGNSGTIGSVGNSGTMGSVGNPGTIGSSGTIGIIGSVCCSGSEGIIGSVCVIGSTTEGIIGILPIACCISDT